MMYLPFIEGAVWADEESLFGWGCFGKSIANVGSKNEEILRGGDGVEQS